MIWDLSEFSRKLYKYTHIPLWYQTYVQCIGDKTENIHTYGKIFTPPLRESIVLGEREVVDSSKICQKADCLIIHERDLLNRSVWLAFYKKFLIKLCVSGALQ